MTIVKRLFTRELECPLDVIASLGEDSRNAWIFISDKYYLDWIKDGFHTHSNKCEYIHFAANKEFPETDIYLSHISDWCDILKISAEDIAFKDKPLNPDIIFLIEPDDKMKYNGGNRVYVPEDTDLFNFIMDMGKKKYYLPTYLVERLLNGSTAKSISVYGKNNENITIKWEGTKKEIILKRFKNLFRIFEIYDEDGKFHICYDGDETVYLV